MRASRSFSPGCLQVLAVQPVEQASCSSAANPSGAAAVEVENAGAPAAPSALIDGRQLALDQFSANQRQTAGVGQCTYAARFLCLAAKALVSQLPAARPLEARPVLKHGGRMDYWRRCASTGST